MNRADVLKSLEKAISYYDSAKSPIHSFEERWKLRDQAREWRLAVVTEERYAVRGELRRGDRPHLPAHEVGYPGQDAEGDDVVERAELRAEIHHVHGAQFDVAQPERGDDALPFRDRFAGQVDTDKFAPGQALVSLTSMTRPLLTSIRRF